MSQREETSIWHETSRRHRCQITTGQAKAFSPLPQSRSPKHTLRRGCCAGLRTEVLAGESRWVEEARGSRAQVQFHREESTLQPDPAGRLQKESVLTGCSGFHSPRSVSQLPGTSGLQAKWRQCRGLSSEKGGWICSQEGKQKPWEKGADPEGALLGLLRIILCPAQLYLYFTLNSSHHRDEFLRENFEEEG